MSGVIAPARFERNAGRLRKNVRDGVGTVQVRVILLADGGNSPQKGNISRTFSIKSARVSEVADFLERAAFGES